MALADDPEFHVEGSIAQALVAIGRVIDGIERLDLETIRGAREPLDNAEQSLLMAIRLRKGGGS
jgi:hypothetical protein